MNIITMAHMLIQECSVDALMEASGAAVKTRRVTIDHLDITIRLGRKAQPTHDLDGLDI